MEITDVYNRLQDKKAKMRDMNRVVVDQLNVHPRYQEIVEVMMKLREEKRSIENELRTPADAQELEAMKIDIKSDKEMLADMSLNMLVAQQPVEIVDEYSRRFVPAFSVKFVQE